MIRLSLTGGDLFLICICLMLGFFVWPCAYALAIGWMLGCVSVDW